MIDEGLLGWAELEWAFGALSDRLGRRSGRAVRCRRRCDGLAYDAQRVTWDVDAAFVWHGWLGRKTATQPKGWDCRRGG